MKKTFTYEIELTPLEADIQLEDIHPVSPYREIYEDLGLGAVVYLARRLDGGSLRGGTIDTLTKGARLRDSARRKKQLT